MGACNRGAKTQPTMDDSMSVSAMLSAAGADAEPDAGSAGTALGMAKLPTSTLPVSDPMWSHKRRTERSVPVAVLSWKMSPPSRVPGGAWMYSMCGYQSPNSRALGHAVGGRRRG